MKYLFIYLACFLTIVFIPIEESNAQTIDAAILHNSNAYMFKDSLYYRFNMSSIDPSDPDPIIKLDEGYPRNLPGGWRGLSGRFLEKIDAALHYLPNNKNYFFSGNEYVRLSGTKVDPGYPKDLPGGWKGLPQSFHSGIDAALFWNDHTYFFKGSEYVRFTKTLMDKGYPRKLPGGWGGLKKLEGNFLNKIDASFATNSQLLVNFFSDDQHAALEGTKASKLDPQSIFVSWPGIPAGRDDLPSTWTTTDVIDSRLDEYAQYSLMRLFRGSVSEKVTASTILGNTKFEKLAGVYVVDQGAAAKRAIEIGKSWWTILPKGVHAVCVPDKDGKNPMIVFSKEIRKDKKGLDEALLSASDNCNLDLIPFFGYTQNLPPKQTRDQTCDKDSTGNGGANIFLTVDDVEADDSFDYSVSLTSGGQGVGTFNRTGPHFRVSIDEGLYTLSFSSKSGHYAYRNFEVLGSCRQNMHVNMILPPEEDSCPSKGMVEAVTKCHSGYNKDQIGCINTFTQESNEPECDALCVSSAVLRQQACLVKAYGNQLSCIGGASISFGPC